MSLSSPAISHQSAYKTQDPLDHRYELDLLQAGFYPWPLKYPSGEEARGTFGYVRESRSTEVVAKCLSPRKIEDPVYRERCVHSIQKEREILKKLSQEKAPHVAGLSKEFEVPGRRYALVLKNGGPNLHEVFEQETSLEDIETVAKQILEALRYLHTRNPPIVHFDIKPQNACLDPEDQLLLVDFGHAEELSEGVGIASLKGSRLYRPPENILGKSAHTPADIWGLGCLLFELATGGLLIPVDGKDGDPGTDAAMFRAHKERLILGLSNRTLAHYETAIRARWGHDLKTDLLIDLLGRMLRMDPNNRETAQELLEHSFFTYEDLRTDTQFSIARVIGNRERFGIRICTLEEDEVLLTLDLTDLQPCYHLPKLDEGYLIQYFDLSDSEQPTLRSERVHIQEGVPIEINLDIVAQRGRH